ncbi:MULTISPECIES: PorP/SprF family type IX secretion system membrane protein [Spirosoma]|uniref:Type IX secretion system membrane protein PorP/SprF n=1 Tax=Spirosoma liriopis TaxID=2937440 RepID=A0ABT0HHY7_9BACT|nr:MULTISPECIES: type IX secretion system membrane protein PorP/SprF [Spirosoma]MCK8491180.1 type IX secretion system membrane protein PorP/SprF [Spirosoma liriopis]UHG90556.1 type IX secretion system membrane protein PorP/SprF [Spirosoma oryzicola]
MIRTLYSFAFLLLMLTARSVVAQQEPQLSMYMYNPLYYNPAAAGSEGVSRIQLTQRTQYLGYQPVGNSDPGGGQNSQILSFNMPLARIKSGIGIYLLNDKVGPNYNQSVQVSYAYRLALKNGTLSLGVQAGAFNKGYDYGQLRPGEAGDPLIPTGRISQVRPDIGAGVYYNTTDYWFGVSVNHINKASYTLGTDRSTNPLYPSAYLTAGYRLGIGYDIDIQPSILIQYATEGGIRNSTATLNIIGTYANRIWAGVGYRYQDAAMITGGINLMRNNALRVGYSLDMVLGASTKSATSHEIILGYALPSPDPRKKPIIRTPRFRY